MAGKPHLVLGLLWQIIKVGLFADIAISGNGQFTHTHTHTQVYLIKSVKLTARVCLQVWSAFWPIARIWTIWCLSPRRTGCSAGSTNIYRTRGPAPSATSVKILRSTSGYTHKHTFLYTKNRCVIPFVFYRRTRRPTSTCWTRSLSRKSTATKRTSKSTWAP